METSERICAVVPTHNKKDSLLLCLDSLFQQGKPIHAVYIVDDASTDGTEQLLQSKNFLDEIPPEGENSIWKTEKTVSTGNFQFRLKYIKLPHNTGSAGAYHEGISQAYKDKFDWIWLIEDDVEVKENSLKNLLDANSLLEDKNTGILASRVLNDDLTDEMNLIHAIIFCERIFSNRKMTPEDFHREFTRVSVHPFVGLLIRSSALTDSIPINRDFFTQADDIFFTRGISKKFNLYIVRKSIIIHKDRKPYFSTKYLKLPGRNVEYLHSMHLWKDYYGCRNLIYLTLRSEGKKNFHLVFFHYMKIMFKNLLFADHKRLRFTIYMKAIRDGITGKLGKTVDPVKLQTLFTKV